MERRGEPATELNVSVPSWVPDSAVHYLAHTEAGLSIRALARGAGCHASTILRQIRRFETRREDPLVDAALNRLGQAVLPIGPGSSPKETRMQDAVQCQTQNDTDTISEADLRREGARVLRRLSESGALLVVATNMEKAVILRDRAGQEPTRTGIVDKDVAEAMALKGWIQCGSAGRITRYTISGSGREALGHLLAETETTTPGFAEAQTLFQPAKAMLQPQPTPRKRKRYAGTESPLLVLARRKDKTGEPFLTEDLVRVGERLREDFELARMEARGDCNWDQYVTGTLSNVTLDDPKMSKAAIAARSRVAAALRDLGQGLGDVALLCCCFLEGLEQTEQRMGWSARSGKVVLRIALQRLKRHYDTLGDASQMIG